MRKPILRALALLLTLSTLAGLCCIGAAAYNNTGDYAKDLVGVALTQVGYRDNPSGHTKYNEWYFGEDREKAWCAVFTSWCANQAEIPETIIRKNEGVMYDYVYEKYTHMANAADYNAVADNFFGGTAYDFGTKTPAPGDLFFSITQTGVRYATHTGIVWKVDNYYIYTIEGNTHDSSTGPGYVKTRKYNRSTGYRYNPSGSLSSFIRLLFFVHPNYENIHDHIYSALVTPVTCTADGYTTYTCSICSESYQGDAVAALGHDYSSEVTTAATCTQDGVMTYTCTRCNDSYTETIPALGHSFTDYIYNNDAQICMDGSETAACDNGCGATDTRTSAGTALPDSNPNNPFIDVAPGQYYYNPVLWAVDQKITSGTTDTTFSPGGDCTRAQVVAFLWRAAGRPEPTTTENPFADVAPGQYYYKAVLWAVENKITSGTSNTTFSPDATCTRAQVVSFLWRAAGRPEPTSDSCSFEDVEAGQYYYKAVLWAVENKITSGTSNTAFSPSGTCIRAQVVSFLWRSAGRP